MISSKRDLLVLSKNAANDPQQMQQEVESLDSILLLMETTKKLCSCTEIIDVNRYKIIRKPFEVEKVVRKNRLKAFQFLYNRN